MLETIFDRVAGLQTETFKTMTFQYICFPVIFLEIIKTHRFYIKYLYNCFWLSSLLKLHNDLAVDFKFSLLSLSSSNGN